MKIRLIERRMLPWPTVLGWLVLLFLAGAPIVWWVLAGEAFFSLNERLPAEVLIVEGFIHDEGVRAAKIEFERGPYRYIVTSGTLTPGHGGPQKWNYATEAHDLLLRLGVPPEKVIAAPALETEAQRTFEAAITVRRALDQRGLHPVSANVFTSGAHARRSRLVFAKALGPTIEVGSISWKPKDYSPGPWWKSSQRAQDLIKETVGWLFEKLLNSGRNSDFPAKFTPPAER